MITVLTGENDFEIAREVASLKASFTGDAEQYDGATLQPRDLPDLLLGSTLFSRSRLVCIKNVSENRDVWAMLPDYIPKLPNEIHVVLIESKLDKRTKTYKILQKNASVKEYKMWSDRDMPAAERWAKEEAGRLALTIDKDAVRLLVNRSLVTSEKGVVIDQWRLRSHLDKLAPLKTVSAGDVETYIDETPTENAFVLLETALRGDGIRVKEMIGRLETSEDPFRLFGLLSGQAFWLATLGTADKPDGEVAKDVGAHPYVLSKLAPFARKLGRRGVKEVISAMADADHRMKTSSAEPWLLIEQALIKIVAKSSH